MVETYGTDGNPNAIIVRPSSGDPRVVTPPGRVVVHADDGAVFQQHWTPGMRGRIYRDLHHPERVGVEVTYVDRGRGSSNFGPDLEFDGTIYSYWWGEVEVLDPIPEEAAAYLKERGITRG